MRRRKAKQFYVSRGLLTAQGATKSEAKAKLETMIDWAVSSGKLHIERRFNWLIVIASDPNGWQSKLVDMTLHHSAMQECSCLQGPEPFDNVLQASRLHAAMNAWSHETNDAEHIDLTGLNAIKQRELASWIQFQRRYKVEKDAGKTDAQAFDIASGNPRVAA